MSKYTKNEGWFTRDECAEIFGCTTKHIDVHYRKKYPKDHSDYEGKEGRNVYLNVPNLIRLLVKSANVTEESSLDEDAGPPSPMLEKLRYEKYLRERLKRLEEEGRLLDSRMVVDGLRDIESTVYTLLDDLIRRFGAEVHEIAEAHLQELTRKVDHKFAGYDSAKSPGIDTEGLDSANAASATPDDAAVC